MVAVRSDVRISFLISTLLGLALLAVGCGSVRTRTGFYEPITENLKSQQYDAAVTAVEKAKESGKYGHKDRLLYYLDAGMANHYAGNFNESNLKLTEAESAAEDLFTKSISRAATSMLLNDNVLEYAGEDYEILYTNLIKALNYIELGEFDEAFVEIRRSNLKLQLLEQKYGDAVKELKKGSLSDTAAVQVEYKLDDVRFHNDAFARYLSMHIYAADGMWDDARIDYDDLVKAFRTQQEVYSFPMPEVNYSPADGKAIVSVVGLAGLSPVKESFDLRIRTDKDLDLVQVLYTDTEGKEAEYGHLPIDIGEDLYFKFSIPRVEARPSTISNIRLIADSLCIGELQLIEDVNSVSQEIFRKKRSMVYFRSVARAVAKALVANRAKKGLDTGGLGGWLKKAAVDVVTEVSEGADLRCSRLLPGKIYVGDFELAPGSYNLRIEFVDINGDLVSITEYTDFEVKGRGLNLLEAFSLN
jgi:hypothetical protein